MQTRGERPRSWKILRGSLVCKAKFFRPGVSSSFISHQLPLLGHFFFQKVGVMIPTLGTVVLEKDR